MSRTGRIAVTASILFIILIAYPSRAARAQNLVQNGSFEEGVGIIGGQPVLNEWGTGYVGYGELLWSDVAHDGTKSAEIRATNLTDAFWTQIITLEPNTTYLLSGWIKTENVAHTPQSVDAGANLCVMGTWVHTPALFGTNDWTFVRLVFNSGATGIVSVGARLGFWSGMTTGTAWFDDVRVTPVRATDPHPSWKFLVLVYPRTDITVWGANGPVHYVGTMTPEQIDAAAEAATRFVETDIPLLTSNNMVPNLTIRYPEMLGQLSPNGGGWWPSPGDTARDRDPAFDSVIVVWQPTVVNQSTGQTEWIGSAAGLTPGMGADQTYASIIIEAATTYGHLNVFKHEWGHSLLSYFDAAGTAPTPTVNNHTDGAQYVHCGTGTYYTWLDETDANPIPNSIYNNVSGFTHDYYSGTTALASNPGACLGVTALAWASGGPVSKPDLVRTPQDWLALLGTQIQRTAAEPLPAGWQKSLSRWMDQVSDAVGTNDWRRLTLLAADMRRTLRVALARQWMSSANAAALQDLLTSLMRSVGLDATVASASPRRSSSPAI